MDENPNAVENSRVTRRTLLKISGGSLGSGALTNAVAGQAGRDPPSHKDDRPDGIPDIVVVDNSASNAAVVVACRGAGAVSDAPGKTDSATVMWETEVSTTGTNHPDLASISTERRAERAVERIDSLPGLPSQTAVLIARHRGNEDSTRINVGSTGANPEEQVDIQIDPDGSVTAGTNTVCHE